jgi:outer membrane protein OmpA-like peptidoglycan-associated protein
LLILVAGCAEAPRTPPAVATELVAVVPGPTGHVGSVVVRSGGSEQVLDTAYAARRVKSDGSTEPARLTPEEVRRAFSGALAALPGRPASFMLYFLEGKDELTQASRSELDKVFAEIRLRPTPDIVVIGHTDTVGSLSSNDRLSLARAERMREMLATLGIPGERILATGRGERELLVPTEDNIPEPRNRRVEISVR